MKSKKDILLEDLRTGLETDTFQKLTLSAFRKSKELNNIYIRPIQLSEGPMCQFVYRYPTKDISKNYTHETSLQLISDFLKDECKNADAQFSMENLSYKRLKSGKEKLSRSPHDESIHSNDHNFKKETFIPESLDFFHHLGLSDKTGRIKDKGRRKYRQVNRFIEILDQQIKKAKFGTPIKIIDMGCGKAYLTFAMYYYFREHLKKEVEIIGIEDREELVELCNDTAKAVDYSGLSFRKGSIIESNVEGTDILVALHACDTATDDAIAKAINSKCSIVITAPCCHKQVRKDLAKKEHTARLMKFGIMTERLAEMLTDVMRAIILEDFQYKTQIIEFTNAANTAKNLLVIGIRNEKIASDGRKELDALKKEYGVERHYLEDLMYNS